MVRKYKIVTLSEFNAIEAAICVGEGIPNATSDGYEELNYLGSPESNKHPSLDLYKIIEDDITVKYCTNFVVLDPTWYPEEI